MRLSGSVWLVQMEQVDVFPYLKPDARVCFYAKVLLNYHWYNCTVKNNH